MSNNNLQVIMQKMSDLLRKHNHTCGIIYGTGMKGDTQKFEWCQQEECEKVSHKNSAKIQTNDVIKLAEELKQKGHTCIYFLRNNPSQIKWCMRDVCIGKKIFNKK